MPDQHTPTPEFIKCTRLLAASWPHTPLTAETVTAYWLVLRDIDPGLLKAAIFHLCATHEDTNFMPLAPVIRRTAFELIENENETPTADDAWTTVMAAMGKYSTYNTPEFDNPLTLQALGGAPGWRAFCVSDVSDVSYHRHQFIKAYDTYIKRERYHFRMLPAVKKLAAQFAGRQLESGVKAPQLSEGEDG